MGVFQSCNVSFCEKLMNTQDCVSRSVIVIEPLCGLPIGSASCHALILQGVEKSLYRRFGLLFDRGVGIQNE